jgi:hypothetical protein
MDELIATASTETGSKESYPRRVNAAMIKATELRVREWLASP